MCVSIASCTMASAASDDAKHPCDCGRVSRNGVVWSSGTGAGPRAPDARVLAESARYGAAGAEDARVHVRVGFRVVSFSPWCPVGSIRMFEEARRNWLAEHGYVGGVRTFVRDEPVQEHSQSATKRAIEPRAVIEIAPDVPRLRGRPQVRVLPSDSALRRSALVRVRVAESGAKVASK